MFFFVLMERGAPQAPVTSLKLTDIASKIATEKIQPPYNILFY